MIVLGIDPGTARMGYGVVKVLKKDTKCTLLRADTIVTAADVPTPQRLEFTYKELLAVIKKYSPDMLVIEKLFFNTNVRTAIAVGQARGVAMLAAASANLMVYEYTALEAKKMLTDFGRASKQEMQEAVKKSLELQDIIKSDDANDAVAMALCFIKKDLKNLW